MKRSSYTSTFLLLLCAFALLSESLAADGLPKPNVLLLIADDLNTWLLGDTDRYAGKVIAPNIQRLAASGVVFNHAYTASPVCSPSRTALLSGVRPWQSGVYDNGVDIGASPALKNATSLPEVLKNSGYSVWSYGKVAHGWDFRNFCDEHIPHRRDRNPPDAPFLPFTRGEQDWGPTHLPEENMNDTSYADATIRQLEKKHDRPFFVACGLFHPHMPWYVPQKYFDLFPDDVPLPEILDNDLDDVPPLGQAFTAGKSKFVEQVRKNGQHASGVRAYLAATAYADAQMGRVLDALERSPYRDNTIVVLMSDHGFHLGEKNHWQKSTLWEEATHCLLMIRAPGTTRAGSKSERCVSLQDLYPTLVELCGLPPSAKTEGRSLVPLLKNPGAEWSSTAITAFNDRNISIRTERFRFIRYRDEQEELYDCIADPHEWRNLASNPDYAAALKELRASVPPLLHMAKSMPTKRGAKDE
ncbi:MAG: sulfatase [Pirellulaceae bacterium]|nr:sulfatase [Pirellulaceae bacterium]